MPIIDLKTIKTVEDGHAAIKKLEDIVTNQNTEIGKYERGEKVPAGYVKASEIGNGTNEEILKRLQKQDEEKYRTQAKEELVKEYGQAVYDLLKDKMETAVTPYLKDPKNASVQLFKGAFELEFARAIKDRNGDVFKAYTGKQDVPPPGDPRKVREEDLDPAQIQRGGGATPPPGENEIPPSAKNTKEAMDGLGQLLKDQFTNPYEQ